MTKGENLYANYSKMFMLVKYLDSRGNPTVEVEVLTESGALDVLLYQVVLLQVNMKQLNYVMVTNLVTLVKVF